MINIAILLAGHTNNAMRTRFPDYADLFVTLFAKSPLAADFTLSAWRLSMMSFPTGLMIMMVIL